MLAHKGTARTAPERIGFKINYVYVKRCVALPGDTISFVHSRPVNNNYHGTIGVPDMQQQLESIPDDQLPWGVMWPILTGDPRLGWSAKNMGPLYVPRCGDIIRMDDWRKADIYRPAIEFETRKPLTWDGEWTTSYAETMPPTPGIRVTGASCRKNTSWAWYRKWWNP